MTASLTLRRDEATGQTVRRTGARGEGGGSSRDGETSVRRPNRLLLKLSRWLFRLVLLFSALPLLLVGSVAVREGEPEGFILLVSGFFILGAEWIFNWFNKLEKL